MNIVRLDPGVVVLVAGEPATILQCLPKSMIQVLRLKDRLQLVIPVEQVNPLPKTGADGKEVYTQELVCIQNAASDNEVKISEERFILVSKYLSREISLSEALATINLKKSRFFELIKLYDSEVGMVSLIRRNRGRKLGEKQLQEQVEEFIADAASKKRSGKKLTFKKAWQEINNRCQEAGLHAPSIGAVTARFKSINAKQLHALRFGAEAADQLYGARPGHRKTQFPLELVQIDHTLVDVILCDQETREPIGRPWLTVAIDVHTRIILGYYIGFNAPSAVNVACAITHAAFPKREYLKNIGAEAELYPFYGVPKILHMDNAKEFRSNKLERACAIHGIKVEFRPPGKKHYGGHIERLIGTLMTSHVHFLSGTTFSNVQQRKGYDSEKKSILSLREFIKWFTGQVAIYHASYHRGLDSTPGDKWISCFTSADMTVNQPPLLRDSFSFRLDFMPEDVRAISPKGIAFGGKHYWSPGLIDFIGVKKAIIKYDPLSLSKVWVRLNGEYLAASFSDLTNSDMTLEEYSLSKKRNLGVKWVSPEALLEVYKNNDFLVSESEKETKRMKKKRQAEKEYANHLRDSGLLSYRPLTEKSAVVNPVDYSIKPTPLPSEDF
ncbi:DDE-type integrase/transposase/recombinase [Pseudomonas allokribbensis]|uniref:DDE-type integrase/transposase/recombinase n=1 Tax=Pseudomonas allokribbensis TaxID=2774460 RepID=UPI001787B4D8|nr:DDE-type integrase/transposase/recombinase [Pseudomonas allokribbensis]